ncbi:MAG: hypothetical protein ACI9L9_002246, partial [Marivirga sp.]
GKCPILSWTSLNRQSGTPYSKQYSPLIRASENLVRRKIILCPFLAAFYRAGFKKPEDIKLAL